MIRIGRRKAAPKKKQHVQLYRKVRLRKLLISHAVEGAAYVPFIGDGDLAKLYAPTHFIFGADLDKARVATAQARFPSALIVKADCNVFPFRDVGARFAIADFDAYADPYRAFESFWCSNAKKAERLVCFFTDDRRGHVRRFKVMRFPDGTKEVVDAKRARELQRTYLSGVVFPWIASVIEPWRLHSQKFYYRGAMTYWGGVIEQSN